jgi:hypothetical protein
VGPAFVDLGESNTVSCRRESNGFLAFWLNSDGEIHAIVGDPGHFDRNDVYAGAGACIA